MSIFGDRFRLGYARVEDYTGDPATYTSRDGLTTQSITVIFNELVGALDPYSNAVFSINTDELASPERGGIITLDSDVWVIVDVRDAKDNSAEVRCIRPEITA